MEGLCLCPPGCLQNPASDIDVNAIVVHHELLGALLAHLVHLWAGRYPLIENAVRLLEELLQHLQAAWTLMRILSSYCQGQPEQAGQHSCMLENPCALHAGSNSLLNYKQCSSRLHKLKCRGNGVGRLTLLIMR